MTNISAMNLETVSEEIKTTYEWFATEAPGVQVQETGQLAQLWALHDYFIREQAIDMTDEQIVYNFGYTTLREVGR